MAMFTVQECAGIIEQEGISELDVSTILKAPMANSYALHQLYFEIIQRTIAKTSVSVGMLGDLPMLDVTTQWQHGFSAQRIFCLLTGLMRTLLPEEDVSISDLARPKKSRTLDIIGNLINTMLFDRDCRADLNEGLEEINQLKATNPKQQLQFEMDIFDRNKRTKSALKEEHAVCVANNNTKRAANQEQMQHFLAERDIADNLAFEVEQLQRDCKSFGLFIEDNISKKERLEQQRLDPDISDKIDKITQDLQGVEEMSALHKQNKLNKDKMDETYGSLEQMSLKNAQGVSLVDLMQQVNDLETSNQDAHAEYLADKKRNDETQAMVNEVSCNLELLKSQEQKEDKEWVRFHAKQLKANQSKKDKLEVDMGVEQALNDKFCKLGERQTVQMKNKATKTELIKQVEKSDQLMNETATFLDEFKMFVENASKGPTSQTMAKSVYNVSELRKQVASVSEVRFIGIGNLLKEMVQQIYTLIIKPNSGKEHFDVSGIESLTNVIQLLITKFDQIKEDYRMERVTDTSLVLSKLKPVLRELEGCSKTPQLQLILNVFSNLFMELQDIQNRVYEVSEIESAGELQIVKSEAATDEEIALLSNIRDLEKIYQDFSEAIEKCRKPRKKITMSLLYTLDWVTCVADAFDEILIKPTPNQECHLLWEYAQDLYSNAAVKMNHQLKEIEERKVAEEKRIEEEERMIEEKRIEEERIAEQKRIELAKKQEKDRLVEEERIAEEKRIEEQRIAEEKRIEEEKIAEEKRIEKEKIAEQEKIEQDLAEKRKVEEETIAEDKRLKEESIAKQEKDKQEQIIEHNVLAEENRIEDSAIVKPFIQEISVHDKSLPEAQITRNIDNNTFEMDICTPAMHALSEDKENVHQSNSGQKRKIRRQTFNIPQPKVRRLSDDPNHKTYTVLSTPTEKNKIGSQTFVKSTTKPLCSTRRSSLVFTPELLKTVKRPSRIAPMSYTPKEIRQIEKLTSRYDLTPDQPIRKSRRHTMSIPVTPASNYRSFLKNRSDLISQKLTIDSPMTSRLTVVDTSGDSVWRNTGATSFSFKSRLSFDLNDTADPSPAVDFTKVQGMALDSDVPLDFEESDTSRNEINKPDVVEGTDVQDNMSIEDVHCTPQDSIEDHEISVNLESVRLDTTTPQKNVSVILQTSGNGGVSEGNESIPLTCDVACGMTVIMETTQHQDNDSENDEEILKVLKCDVACGMTLPLDGPIEKDTSINEELLKIDSAENEKVPATLGGCVLTSDVLPVIEPPVGSDPMHETLETPLPPELDPVDSSTPNQCEAHGEIPMDITSNEALSVVEASVETAEKSAAALEAELVTVDESMTTNDNAMMETETPIDLPSNKESLETPVLAAENEMLSKSVAEPASSTLVRSSTADVKSIDSKPIQATSQTSNTTVSTKRERLNDILKGPIFSFYPGVGVLKFSVSHEFVKIKVKRKK